MFDLASELFGFMNQRPRYERELKEDTVNGYHIDTCAVDDRDWNYETAIQHEQFRGGEWIVVRGYDSKEEAEAIWHAILFDETEIELTYKSKLLEWLQEQEIF